MLLLSSKDFEPFFFDLSLLDGNDIGVSSNLLFDLLQSYPYVGKQRMKIRHHLSSLIQD
jgi:hypothetical protein